MKKKPEVHSLENKEHQEAALMSMVGCRVLVCLRIEPGLLIETIAKLESGTASLDYDDDIIFFKIRITPRGGWLTFTNKQVDSIISLSYCKRKVNDPRFEIMLSPKWDYLHEDEASGWG